VTTNDPRIAQTVRMLRDHGQRAKYHHQLEGYNGRLDALQAAFLRIKLTKLTDWNDARRSLAARYRQLLKDVVQVPTAPAGTRPVYHLYVIRTRDRDGLARQLSADGIQTGLHYPVPLHLQNCYRQWGYPVNSLAVTERVASEVLSLPMFPGLTADDQSRIAEAIAAFIESRRPETATARCGMGEAS
jgi:dTDP-4-amino-4,6-dideoxygalactose transaminase